MAGGRPCVAGLTPVPIGAAVRARREGGTRSAGGGGDQERRDRGGTLQGVTWTSAAVTCDSPPTVCVHAGRNVALTPGMSPVGMLVAPA